MDTNTTKATQDFIPIKEIRDGIVILKDGSIRAILLTSSINFSLKSSDEQASVLLQFQNFLNSLDFSLQIFVSSRRFDVRPYILTLEERLKEQTNDLLRVQTKEYIEYIKSFTGSVNIMTKNFFVVVPYTPAIISTKGSSFSIFGKNSQGQEDTDSKSNFEESRTQLEQRIAVVEQGLARTGVRITQLGSEEVIEVFYKMFNPGEEKPMNVPQ